MKTRRRRKEIKTKGIRRSYKKSWKWKSYKTWKNKKIIYESEPEEQEEEVEEVIIKKKKAPKKPSYADLADMSVEQHIKNPKTL